MGVDMSLVPTYVQSTSGKWYKNPVIEAEDGTWFVCWDDDDPIELVIAEDGPEPDGAINRLRGEGWDVRLGRKHQGPIAGRFFNGKLRPTRGAWWLRQNRGPTDALLAGYEPLDAYAADCVAYPDGRAS